MAIHEKEVPTRKKLVTYGKTTRKRISVLDFNSVSYKSTIKQNTQIEQSSEGQTVPGVILNTATEGAPDKTTATSIKLAKNVFDISSDDEDDEKGQLQNIPKLFNSNVSRQDVAPRVPSHDMKEIHYASLLYESSLSLNRGDTQSTLSAAQKEPAQLSLIVSCMESSNVPVSYSEDSVQARKNVDGLDCLHTIQQGAKTKTSSILDELFDPKSDECTSNPKRKHSVAPVKSQNYKSSQKLLNAPTQNNSGIYDIPLNDEETATMKYFSQPPQKNMVHCTDEGSKKKLKPSAELDQSYPLPSLNPRTATKIKRRQHISGYFSSDNRQNRQKLDKSFHELSSKRQSPRHTPYGASPISNSEEIKLSRPLPTSNIQNLDSKHDLVSKGQNIRENSLSPSKGQHQVRIAPHAGGLNTHTMAVSSSAKPYSTLLKSEEIESPAHKYRRNSRRPRLIDSLVQQASNTDSSDDIEYQESDLEQDPQRDSGHIYESPCLSSSETIVIEQPNIQFMITESQSSVSSLGIAPRFTYNRQRSMLAEEDLMKELAHELPSTIQASSNKRNRRGSIPKLEPLSIFHEEDEESNQVVIKSVHELRKSGANKRFVDECTDFLERIGSPGQKANSIRRSGLMDLASKMRRKTFAQQFRANSMEQQLFIDLGKEKDIVSGFLMISILIFVLIEGPLPHIIPHLCHQGIIRLISRLVDCDSSIATVCKDRKTNMSKVAQSLIIEHHDCLLQSNLWEDLEPEFLKPRTIALQCLVMVIRRIREAENFGDIFSEELNTKLFSIMETASDNESWDLPKNSKAIEFALAVAALQAHSVFACTLLDDSIWISDYLPKLANALELSLLRPHGFYSVNLLILKMTLQVTNDNQLASGIFAQPSLIFVLSKKIVSHFHEIHGNLSEKEFTIVLDHLSLLLGILMNFSEWSLSARQCMQNFQHQEVDPLEEMLHIFKERSDGITQAESEQETLKNIVLSYLAVTLGFLSEHPVIAERIESQKKELVSCIEEFISIHKLADRKLVDSAEYSSSGLGEDNFQMEIQKELTERLERLVGRLKCAV